ncbi:MAG: hypothetical protein M3N98_01385 [Actinomycetota bacterium]|nr:hypothetical protein [Actinomycetota bacterium]
MNTRRIVAFGAAVLGVYLAVALATLALSGRPVLPLFEGVGPPPPYQWVNPPPGFAAGNTKPKPSNVDIPFSGAKSPGASVSPDGQFVVNFGVGDFAPHSRDTALRAFITPLDPATLGPLPAGLAADGNAYRVQLTYQPSATPLDSLAQPGDVFVTAPIPAQALLYSSDGQTWTTLAIQTGGGTSSVAAMFSRPGWYLVGASPTAVAPRRPGLGRTTVVVALLVAGLAVVLAVAPLGFLAVRRRRSRHGTGPAAYHGPTRAKAAGPKRRP